MKKTVIALLVVLAMIFSTAACFAAEEEDEIVLGTSAEDYGIMLLSSEEDLIMTIMSAPTVTRAAAVKEIWEKAGEPVVNYAMAFKDVDADSDYAEAVRWAASEGIVNGYDADTFGPEDEITREQVACLIYRYEQKENNGGFTGMWAFLLDFDDSADVSDWANEAVHWVYMNEILNKDDSNHFYPTAVVSTSEFEAAMEAFFGSSEIVGGWTAQDGTISAEAQAVFDKAMEGYTGVGYTAKKLLGTQVVAGTNYKFLCDATVIYPGAATTEKVVVIYEDLEGNAVVSDIYDYAE